MIDALVSMAREGRWSLGAIVATSTIAWSLVLWEWLRLREREERTGVEARELLHSTRSFDVASAARPTTTVSSELTSSVRSLLASRETVSRDSFEARVQPILRHEVVSFERPLGVLRVLTTSLPLLGLLGTVLGMKTTFEALMGARALGFDTVAGGISQALVTTQAGLVLAVPLWLAHGILAFRVRRATDRLNLLIKKVETAVCADG